MTPQTQQLFPEGITCRVRGNWTTSLSMFLIAGAITFGVLGCMDFMTGDQQARLQFKYAYLTAFAFCIAIPLGALFFVMIQHVTNAKWSIVVRRIAEQLMMTFPLMLILFIPILYWMQDRGPEAPSIFPWARPEMAGHLHGKEAYLNPQFFTIRAAIYFAIWIGLAFLLRAKSLRMDQTGNPRLKLSMSRLSAPGILLFALSITFAAFDWFMSLDPLWFSTIYGVYYFAVSMLAFYAVMILLSAAVEKSGDVGPAITTEHFHDLGKFLFGFTVFWAYIAFSQLLLIWMANMPEETHWYYDRWHAPGWRTVSYTLVFGHFVIPFLYLLPRTIKRIRPTLVLGAVWILLMHYVDMVYLVMPAFTKEYVAMSIRQPLLCAGMFFLQLAYFFWIAQKAPLLPVRDPKLAASMAFENF